MPIACSSQALTGQEGSIYFKPAGTQYCLTAADFPAGTVITVPSSNDYRVGDPVEFTVEGTATIDTSLNVATTYFVVAPITSTSITISATKGGSAITLAGDSDDTGGGHFKISFAEYEAVCQVREFSLDLTRESLDVTTLPCGISAAGTKYAAFKKTQPGYASGTGTMSVYFTDDQTSLANRLLGNVLLRSQEGAYVKLYVNTVSDGATPPAPDDAQSLYIQSGISIEGMNLSVNPDDATVAELSYTITNPEVFLGTVIG